MSEKLKSLKRRAAKAMKEMRAKLAKAIPPTRKFWQAYGYYVSLGALLLLFGIAAYSYKNNPDKTELTPAKPAQTPAAITVSSAYEPAAPTPTPAPRLEFIAPVSGETLTEYSPDKLVWNATLKQWETHSAIDIAAPTGTAVLACEAGTVTAAYKDALLGYVVEITHEDGYVSRCASLGTLELVEIGQRVARGDIIGSVGTTAAGEAELGAHLHYSMTLNGETIEPRID